jgi:L-threonylcarbamoyladenylate synthase
MKKPYLLWKNPETASRLADLISNGTIVLAAGDTVPGLLTAVCQTGYHNLNVIKGRGDKPYIILVSHPEDVLEFTSIDKNSPLWDFMQKCWPGPVTLLLPAKKELPEHITGGKPTIGIRVPAHEGLRAVAPHAGPLFSTSANYAGKPTPKRIIDVDSAIVDAVAAIVNDDEQEIIVASTILDCSQLPVIRVMREGAYEISKLEKIGSSFVFKK